MPIDVPFILINECIYISYVILMFVYKKHMFYVHFHLPLNCKQMIESILAYTIPKIDRILISINPNTYNVNIDLLYHSNINSMLKKTVLPLMNFVKCFLGIAISSKQKVQTFVYRIQGCLRWSRLIIRVM